VGEVNVTQEGPAARSASANGRAARVVRHLSPTADAERDDHLAANGISVRRHELLLRLAATVGILCSELLRTGPPALVIWTTRGPAAARRRGYRGLVRALQTLGPTFVKFGQISAVRTDALPLELCEEMSRLHDAVVPMRPKEAELALRAARDRRSELHGASVDLEPVGSGSIACVYRAVLPGGDVVALKLKRPGLDHRMHCDLALLRVAVRAAQRLPKLRGMPIADLVSYVSEAIVGQLNFDRELQNTGYIRDALASMPDVRVPAAREELCTPNCLVFDYLPGLDTDTAGQLPDERRAEMGALVLAAVHRLFFVHGLVHCDLHPGNLYITRQHQLVILDGGYCVRLPDKVRHLIGEFFARLAVGDGRRCGEIVLESAVNLDRTTDREGFLSDFAALVAQLAGPGHDFDFSTFGDAVYELQQRYGIYAASDFAFPLMSLLVVDGTVRRVWPEIDFQAIGTPGPAP
jgi:ubiquinone biosynthesis protein